MYVPTPGFLASRDANLLVAGSALAVAIAVNREQRPLASRRRACDKGILARNTSPNQSRLKWEVSDLLGIHPADNGVAGGRPQLAAGIRAASYALSVATAALDRQCN